MDSREKIRLARRFNDALSSKSQKKLDGRIGRRLSRYRTELAEKSLAPYATLFRVSELLKGGDQPSTIKKLIPKSARVRVHNARFIDALRGLHEVHQFPVDAYRIIGASTQDLQSAGILVAQQPDVCEGEVECEVECSVDDADDVDVLY